jgi:hypothetical protein
MSLTEFLSSFCTGEFLSSFIYKCCVSQYGAYNYKLDRIQFQQTDEHEFHNISHKSFFERTISQKFHMENFPIEEHMVGQQQGLNDRLQKRTTLSQI